MGWLHAALWASLVWIAVWWPSWAPLVVVVIIVLQGFVSRDRTVEPWSSAAVALSALTYLAISGGWEVAAGWFLLAALTGAMRWAVPRPAKRGPDAADFLAIGGWGLVFVFAPKLVEASSGGWLAPGVLLMAVRRMVGGRVEALSTEIAPAPPLRELRGTLSLESVVFSGADGLPRTVPIDLELRPGQSVAILCDDPDDSEALAAGISGRVRPRSGEIIIDGAPMDDGSRLVAMVAPGEPFLEGDLAVNLGSLCTEPLDRSTRVALYEACSLAEVADALGEQMIAGDGAPMSSFHRMLVLVARVIPSQYHVMVVVDPVPWVNAVHRENWRAAVVRASLGRTAIWITPDLELAYRASEVLEFRDGALRPLNP